MRNNVTWVQQYELLEKVGKGSYGDVWKVRWAFRGCSSFFALIWGSFF